MCVVYQDLYLCVYAWFILCLSSPEALVAIFSRKSFWRSWRTWNRRRWTKTCWRSEDQRMSPSPMCLQLHYLPNLVRAFYKTDTVIQQAFLQNPFFKLKEESKRWFAFGQKVRLEDLGNHRQPQLYHFIPISNTFVFCLFFLFSLLKAKKEEDDEDMEDLQRWAMEAM